MARGSKSSNLADGGAFPALLQNLRVLGYIEGTNLTVDSRFAEGRPEALAGLAAQLVHAKPDVIAVSSAGLAMVVLEHTKTIPVVALTAGEPRPTRAYAVWQTPEAT